MAADPRVRHEGQAVRRVRSRCEGRGEGHNALHAAADGPLLLPKAVPGRYAGEATLPGKTLHQKVLVKQDQPAKAVFRWPIGAGESRS